MPASQPQHEQGPLMGGTYTLNMLIKKKKRTVAVAREASQPVKWRSIEQKKDFTKTFWGFFFPSELVGGKIKCATWIVFLISFHGSASGACVPEQNT